MTKYEEQTRLFEIKRERDRKARKAKEARLKGGELFPEEKPINGFSLHFDPAPASRSGALRST